MDSNNDILRKLRYALNLRDNTMVEIFSKAGYSCEVPEVLNLLKKEEEDGYLACSDYTLALFLDGLIIFRRGVVSGKPTQLTKRDIHLNNNIILKKLRIALEFKEEDMLEAFALGERPLKEPELTAIFRKEGHKNFKLCGGQYLRAFLKGITKKFRKN